MTSATIASPDSLRGDTPWLTVVRPRTRQGAVADDQSDERWTTPKVAEVLGRHRTRVNEIPRDELPYEETSGGRKRGGRRYYRPEDVLAYKRRQEEKISRVDELEQKVADLRADVDDLNAWRARRDHDNH